MDRILMHIFEAFYAFDLHNTIDFSLHAGYTIAQLQLLVRKTIRNLKRSVQRYVFHVFWIKICHVSWVKFWLKTNLFASMLSYRNKFLIKKKKRKKIYSCLCCFTGDCLNSVLSNMQGFVLCIALHVLVVDFYI